jgi:protein O-GlcNAc transferase
MPSDMKFQQKLKSGVSHHQAGRFAEAERIYRDILARQPDQADALYLLGVLIGQGGRLEESLELIRRTIRINPNFAEAHNDLGTALAKNKQLEEAIAGFRNAIRLKPDFAEAHFNLGVALQGTGQLSQAMAAFHEAIRFKPGFAEAHYNLANALKEHERLDEAIASYGQAIRLKPDFADAHHNLGSALHGACRLNGTIAAYRQAIRFRPDFAKAYGSLGNTLKDMGQMDEAIACYRQAIRLMPDFAETYSNLLFALHYHSAHTPEVIAEEHRRWNRQYAEPLRNFILPHANDRDPDRRLRIGYVSADFCVHSVSRFLLPLFRQHDHGTYEIICYSDSLKSDHVTDRLRACADGWENIVGWTDERVADKVREDKIDILVDLAGHTAGNRLKVFARKPAPVQVSYLGYPGSTGLSAIDYRLTDTLADPPGVTESFHTETLVRLPVCNWCFSEPDDAPPVGSLPAESNGSICFGTFNNFAKASPMVMDLWARILGGVGGSRLVIKSRGLGEPGAHDRIRRFFGDRGISANRLETRGLEQSVASHLGAYNGMDIALDTFPYHGTTTTCEALWMGVPVVTLAGQIHVSRVGVSLLSNVGLGELIGHSPEEYVSIAVALGKNVSRIGEIRRTLRERMRASPLMNASRFARDMEGAFRSAWRNWCRQVGS